MLLRGLAAERHRTLAGRQLGLNRTEAAVVALLGTCPLLSISELADRLALNPTGVSVLVQRLERRGTVERHAHPYDHRQVLITATRAQIDAATELYAPLIAQLDQLIQRLPATTQADALALVPDLIAVLHEHADTLLDDALHHAAPVSLPIAPGPWA